MPNIDRLYPEEDNDIVAVFTSRTNNSGNLNWKYIGSGIASDIAGGLASAGAFGTDLLSRFFNWVTENTQVDQDFLDELGKQHSPYWGADDWHPIMAPKGYVDRFEMSKDTIIIVVGLLLARIVLGKVGIKGITKFAGGQSAKFSARKRRQELLDSIAAEDDDIEAGFNLLMSQRDLQAQRDAALSTFLVDSFRAYAANDRHGVDNAAELFKALQL